MRKRYEDPTISSRLKQRVSEDIDSLWEEIEEVEEEVEVDETSKASQSMLALARLKRSAKKDEKLDLFVANTKKNFLLQFSLNVKHEERLRLERVLRSEEAELAKAEAELRLAQQAFDQFLQEKDRSAVQAQKKADSEIRVRLEKSSDITFLDEGVLAIKRTVNKLKDQLCEYSTFESFLYSLSPEAWRQVQEQISQDQQQEALEEDDVECLEAAARRLGVGVDEFGPVGRSVKLYFKDPNQLLSLFADLEDENLGLIEQCQEAEDRLETVKKKTSETRTRLDHQSGKLEKDIESLESQLASEAAALASIEAAIEATAAVTAAADVAACEEDLELQVLDRLVSKIHDACVGPSRSKVSTLEKLKRIELTMENLTKDLDLLPQEKVKIAQKTCERDRRRREAEAEQRELERIHEERNRRARDRALAPMFIKPALRRFLPPRDVLDRRRRRLDKIKRKLKLEQQEREEDEDSEEFNV